MQIPYWARNARRSANIAVKILVGNKLKISNKKLWKIYSKRRLFVLVGVKTVRRKLKIVIKNTQRNPDLHLNHQQDVGYIRGPTSIAKSARHRINNLRSFSRCFRATQVRLDQSKTSNRPITTLGPPTLPWQLLKGSILGLIWGKLQVMTSRRA